MPEQITLKTATVNALLQYLGTQPYQSVPVIHAQGFVMNDPDPDAILTKTLFICACFWLAVLGLVLLSVD